MAVFGFSKTRQIVGLCHAADLTLAPEPARRQPIENGKALDGHIVALIDVKFVFSQTANVQPAPEISWD